MLVALSRVRSELLSGMLPPDSGCGERSNLGGMPSVAQHQRRLSLCNSGAPPSDLCQCGGDGSVDSKLSLCRCRSRGWALCA